MRPELRDIVIHGTQADEPVCAIVFGAFAVHETINCIDLDYPDHRYFVTRVACGLKFPRHFTKDDAIELAVEANAVAGRLPWRRAEPLCLEVWTKYRDRGVFEGHLDESDDEEIDE